MNLLELALHYFAFTALLLMIGCVALALFTPMTTDMRTNALFWWLLTSCVWMLSISVSLYKAWDLTDPTRVDSLGWFPLLVIGIAVACTAMTVEQTKKLRTPPNIENQEVQ